MLIQKLPHFAKLNNHFNPPWNVFQFQTLFEIFFMTHFEYMKALLSFILSWLSLEFKIKGKVYYLNSFSNKRFKIELCYAL